MSCPRVKLGEVCTINPRLPKDTDESQNVSFLTMSSVSEKGKILNQEARILSETKKGFTYFEINDILLAKITPCFENGKAVHASKLETAIGYGSTEFHVLRALNEVADGKYIFYLVWNDIFRFHGKHSMRGAAGQKRVSADFLKQFKIPLPPLAEQQKIAAILDTADQLRQKDQQLIDHYTTLSQSLFLDMFGDPVTNPMGWDESLLSEVVDNRDSKRVPIKQLDRKKIQGKFPYYGATGIVDYINKYIFDGEYLLIAEDGKNLENRKKPIAWVVTGKFWVNNHAHIVKSNNYANLYFLQYHLNQMDISKYVTGIDQFKMNKSNLNRIPIMLPPIVLQNQFAQHIEKMEQQKHLAQASLEKSETLFNSLLQRAFKGELTINKS